MTAKQHLKQHRTGPASHTLAGPDAFHRLRTGMPSIMGILNVTPDSFSDGGTLKTLGDVLRRAEAHVAAGASMLDIGGESTRPGAVPVDADEQKRRVLPVVEAIVAEGFAVPLSLDTCDAQVAQAAIERGVGMINDVTGLRSQALARLVARTGVHAIVMHLRGTPQTMQNAENCSYRDVARTVASELCATLAQAQQQGIAKDKLWIDPGIGFSKTHAQNWQLTRHLDVLLELGYPTVFGPSRKGFLTTAVARPALERDAATAAICTAAVVFGAQVVRVHNVGAVKDAVAVGWALRQTP